MSNEAFENALAYIDTIEPEHFRTGCEDPHSYNAAFNLDGQVHNKCARCTLIRVAQAAAGIEPFVTGEDDE